MFRIDDDDEISEKSTSKNPRAETLQKLEQQYATKVAKIEKKKADKVADTAFYGQLDKAREEGRNAVSAARGETGSTEKTIGDKFRQAARYTGINKVVDAASSITGKVADAASLTGKAAVNSASSIFKPKEMDNTTRLYSLLYETPDEERQNITRDTIMVTANRDVDNAKTNINDLKIAVTRASPDKKSDLQALLKEAEQKLKNAENKVKELLSIKGNPNDFVNQVYDMDYNKASRPVSSAITRTVKRPFTSMGNMFTSRSSSNSVTQKNTVGSRGPGKKITITFIQDDRNQCFIKDYNLCKVDNVGTELSGVYDDKLVVDGNNKPVKKNIQNIGKNQTVNYNCDSGASRAATVTESDGNENNDTKDNNGNDITTIVTNNNTNNEALGKDDNNTTDMNGAQSPAVEDVLTFEDMKKRINILKKQPGGYNSSKSITRRKSAKPMSKRLLRYSRRSRNSKKF